MQRDDTDIHLAQDTAMAEKEHDETPNLTAADDIKAIPSLDLRELPMQDPPDVRESELLVAVKSTPKSKLRELIRDKVEDELFKRNKLHSMADKESDAFPEPKNTIIFEMQDVISKSLQIRKKSIDNSCIVNQETSDPWTILISDKSKKHEQYMNRSYESKPIEAETSESKDDKSSSAVHQEYTPYRMPRKQKLIPTLSDDTSDKPLRSRKEPEQQMRQSSASKLQRKIESACSSELSETLIQPCKCGKKIKNKLLFSDKTVQVNLIHENVTMGLESSKPIVTSKGFNLESTKPKAIKKLHESSALESHRGIETTNPDLKIGATETTGSFTNRKSEISKLLSCTSKKQTNKKMPMLSKKYAGSSTEADNIDFEHIKSDSTEDLYKNSALEPPRQELSPELGHGTPEPIRSIKHKKTNRMKLYQNLMTKNKVRRAARKNIASTSKAIKDESSETSGFEYQEKRDSQLTELSEGTPEPIQSKRRIPLRMSILSTVTKKYKKKNFFKEKVDTSELDESEMDIILESFHKLKTPQPRNDLELSQSLDLSKGRPKRKMKVRTDKMTGSPASGTIPRTRILITPERKEKNNTLKKNLRRLANKRKLIRMKHQMIQLQPDFRQAEITSSSCGTISDSGNIGDCSGSDDYDDNVKKRKKVKRGNNKISGGSVKGDNGGSGSNRGMDDTSHNKGGEAGYSGSNSGEIRGIPCSGHISSVSGIADGGMCDSSMIGIFRNSGLNSFTGGLRGIDDHDISGVGGIGGGGGSMGYTTSLSGMGYSELGYSTGSSGICCQNSGIRGMFGTDHISGMLGSGRISGSAGASSMIGMGGMGSGMGYSSSLSSMGYNPGMPAMGASYSGAALSGMGYGGNYSNSITSIVDGGGISNIGYADMRDIDVIRSMGDNAAADTMGDGGIWSLNLSLPK